MNFTKYFISIIGLICLGCSYKRESPRNSVKNNTEDKSTYINFGTKEIKGDFDGDGRQDIVRWFVADSTGQPVKQLPEHDTWEETVAWFGKQGYYTAVVMTHKPLITLRLDNSQGLYCLINIGDNNNDKRDEIALVSESMDFSRHNYCHIYSLCALGWKELFSFNVHEDAFDHNGNTQPAATNIPAALEYRNNKWYYMDYLEMDYKTAEEVGQMLPLIIRSCQK